MSHETHPISPARFASALEDLPLGNLYSKAFEIRNSIAHLQRSNEELQAYSDSQRGGDADCLEAVRENEAVVERMRERVGLVKREVERRGGRWHEAGVEVDGVDGEKTDGGVVQNGHINGEVDGVHGLDEDAVQEGESGQIGHPERADDGGQQPAGGRLDDEELRRRMLERMGEDDDEGMHL
jgi:hypothetical protein